MKKNSEVIFDWVKKSRQKNERCMGLMQDNDMENVFWHTVNSQTEYF